MKKSLVGFVAIILFLSAGMASYAQTGDTIIGGKHYNTVICYQNFQYKDSEPVNKVIAFGNTVNGVKTGHWKYVEMNSRIILAQGKYRDGYKKGKWIYSDAFHSFPLHWKKSEKAQCYITFAQKNKPQIVDFNAETKIKILIAGHPLPNPVICWR